MKVFVAIGLIIFCTKLFSQASEKGRDSCTIFVPNVTGPHSEINDMWVVRPTCAVKKFRMTVFNRWGEKIYQQDSLGKYNVINWDFYSINVKQDTYVWKIKCNFGCDKTEKELTGKVTIIR